MSYQYSSFRLRLWLSIVLFYAASRLILVGQNLDPYMFCDESSIVSEIEQMVFISSVQMNYRFLGTNTTPLFIILKFLDMIHFPIQFSANDISVMGRILYLILLPIFASYFLGLLVFQITRSENALTYSQILFLFTPTVYFRSLVFYPDSYLPSLVIFLLFYSWKIAHFSDRRTSVLLGLNIALVISAKPSTVVYLPFIIASIFLLRRSQGIYNFYFSMLPVLVVATSVFCILNFGAFFDPKNLFFGMRFNFQNYTILDFDAQTVFLFNLFSLFPLSLFFGFLLYLYAALFSLISWYRTRSSNTFLLTCWLLLVPLVFLSIFSAADRLIVRNSLVIFPIFVVGITCGIYSILGKTKILGKILVVGFCLQFGITFVNNFQIANYPDERSVARVLETYIPDGQLVGVNTTCNGNSPAEVVNYETELDPNFELGLEFYLIDSRGNPPYEFQSVDGIFFDQNFVASHFNQFDNSLIFKHVINQTIRFPGYRILRTLETNNANFYIVQKE